MSALQKVKGYVILCIVAVVYFPIRWLYRVANRIFHLDRRGAARNLRNLKREVENQYEFLFAEHGGRIVPELTSGSPSNDFATVVVALSHLYVLAARDRGYTEWYVSLNADDRPWKRLDLILKKISPPTEAPWSDYQGLRFHLAEIEQAVRSES